MTQSRRLCQFSIQSLPAVGSLNKLGRVYHDTICSFSGSDEETWPTLSQQSTKKVRQLKSNKGHKAAWKYLHFSVAQTHPSPASLHEWSHFVKSAWISCAQQPMNRHKIDTTNDFCKEPEGTFTYSLQSESFLLDFHTVSMTCWTDSWGKNDLLGLMALIISINSEQSWWNCSLKTKPRHESTPERWGYCSRIIFLQFPV